MENHILNVKFNIGHKEVGQNGNQTLRQQIFSPPRKCKNAVEICQGGTSGIIMKFGMVIKHIIMN